MHRSYFSLMLCAFATALIPTIIIFSRPTKRINKPFRMDVQDVYSVKGALDVVFTGQIALGTIKVGEKIEVIGLTGVIQEAKITGIEKDRVFVNEAKAGDLVALALRGIKKNADGGTLLQPGHLLLRPGMYNLDPAQYQCSKPPL